MHQDNIVHHISSPSNFNHRFVLLVMGVLCVIQVPVLLIALLVSLYYGTDAGAIPVSVTAGVMLLVGAILCLLGRHASRYDAGRREGILSVSLSWFVVGTIGMLPLWIGGFVPTVGDAFFETIAGLTTTGASVITDIEALPKSILFWRSILQWEGGVGIVVFLVAFLPIAGGSAGLMFENETTGVTHDRFVPRVGVMAQWIVLIYAVLTVLCILLLWAGPMSLFDAVCHGATCISTGGLSTKNNSIEYFDSRYINWVVIIFMIVGATSFRLLYLAIICRQPSKLFKDSEFRWFISLIVIFGIVGAAWLYFSRQYDSVGEALERSAFAIASVFSSSAYSFGDYSEWGSFFGLLVLIAMFISGCSGSTSGGLKVIRFQILFLTLNNEIRKRTHPNAVLPYRMGEKVLGEQHVYRAMTFFFAYLSLILISTFCITLEGYDVIESMSAAISCASNSGAGLGHFGPSYGFGHLTVYNKMLLSFLMIMGRLEIFTVISLFHKSFWRS